jgi:hypothetical protein
MTDTRRYCVRGVTVYSEAQVLERIQRALELARLNVPSPREMYVKTLEQLGITKYNSSSTPSANWFINGEENPFPELINQERGSLMLGDHTDDELANAVFMHGNPSDREKTQRLMSGQITDIAYLTAAKERIRWLSRHLESSLKANQELVNRILELEAIVRSQENEDEHVQ